jgi:Uroporphyrinogen decarboxylase (URO-D)
MPSLSGQFSVRENVMEDIKPRQVVKELLQGISPPRPLFLPIVFSLGAKVKNLSLRTFLGNPTKISGGLRQIRARVRSDGVTCYFDPFLEAEALGGALQWKSEDSPPEICWPRHAKKGDLPEDLRSPEECVKAGRVPVAMEVIHGLKSSFRDDTLLTVGVSGPFTLAALLAQLDASEAEQVGDLPPSAIETSAAVITAISRAFAEAGANVIFIREEVLPALSPEECTHWSSLLATTINIIRFYEALPVLLFTDQQAFDRNIRIILQQDLDCVVCPPLQSIFAMPSENEPKRNAKLGIALPLEAFQPGAAASDDPYRSMRRAIEDMQPAILTTVGDLPSTADVKRLDDIFGEVSGTVRAETDQ